MVHLQPASRLTVLNFSVTSKADTSYENMPFMHSAYYEDMSPTKALLGADNCFINVWGGEIIRDNFNVTINKQRGMSNAVLI